MPSRRDLSGKDQTRDNDKRSTDAPEGIVPIVLDPRIVTFLETPLVCDPQGDVGAPSPRCRVKSNTLSNVRAVLLLCPPHMLVTQRPLFTFCRLLYMTSLDDIS